MSAEEEQEIATIEKNWPAYKNILNSIANMVKLASRKCTEINGQVPSIENMRPYKRHNQTGYIESKNAGN